MADGHDVFNANIKATDQASPLLQRIAASVKGLAPLMDAVKTHSAGMSAVLKAAMGEAEHAAHGAGKAAHGAGHEIAAAGHAATKAGPQIEHAAHPAAWAALAAHANLFRSHLGGIRVGVGEIGHSITEFLPALGALAAGGGLVGLFELTEKVSDSFSELSKAAIEAGVTTQQFEQLSLAAKMTDVSVESMGNSLFKLNKAIATSAAGKNKDALALFEHLGIHVREANGHLANSAQILPELAEAFKRTADPAMRARMAMTLFGKAGAEMLPLLMQGREELENFTKESDRLRYPFSEADKEGLEGFHRSMIGLNVAVSGFGNEIGAKLAPVLQPVIEMVTEWVAANRDWIATGITSRVEQLAKWVERLNLKEIIEQTRDWAAHTLTLGGHVDGATTVIGALVLAVGSPLIAGISGAIAIVGALGSALMTLTAVAFANPIIAGAAAIGLAAYELYEHWDWVTKSLGEAWDWTTRKFGEGTAWIKEKFSELSEWFAQSTWAKVVVAGFAPVLALPAAIGAVVYEIYEHWDWLTKNLGEAWDWTARKVSEGAALIKQTLGESVDWITQKFGEGTAWIKQKFSEIWDWFGQSTWAQAVVAAFVPVIGLPGEIILHWDTIKEYFTTLFKWLGDEFEAAYANIKPIVDKLAGAMGAVQNSWIGRQLNLSVDHNATPGAGAQVAPSPWAFPMPPMDMPVLYGPGGSVPSAAPPASRDGTVKTEITIKGLPQHSTVQSSASGIAETPRVDVGWALASQIGAF